MNEGLRAYRASAASALLGGGLLALGLLAIGPAVTSSAPVPRETPRFAGEYGLVVYEHRDSLVVHWLTETEAAGSVRLYTNGQLFAEATTAPALAHRAALDRPRGREVVLRYGVHGPDGAQHDTTIRLGTPARPGTTFRGVDSLFVVGDVHGEFDRLVGLLRNGGLIDDDLRWIGGRSHLAILGDMTDRGPDVLRTLWFLYDLEEQARQARGRVHIVLGNHEIMVMLADLRYVDPKELEIADRHGISYDRLLDPRLSVLGRWLVSKPALIRVDRVLMAHGGAAPASRAFTLRSLDDSIARYMHDDVFYRWADTTAVIAIDSLSLQRRIDFFWGPESMLWYRGYAQQDTLDAQLRGVLRHFGADIHVVGHTPFREITSRYDGAFIATNTAPNAIEALLLVRRRGGYDRFRIPLGGPLIPL
jgi:hypothetical protein